MQSIHKDDEAEKEKFQGKAKKMKNLPNLAAEWREGSQISL